MIKPERRFLFERTYVEKIKNDIADGKNTALKSRRNKKYVSGNDIYRSYISDTSKNMAAVQRTVDRIREKGIIVTDDLMRAIIAECAIQIKDNGQRGRRGEIPIVCAVICMGN